MWRGIWESVTDVGCVQGARSENFAPLQAIVYNAQSRLYFYEHILVKNYAIGTSPRLWKLNFLSLESAIERHIFSC